MLASFGCDAVAAVQKCPRLDVHPERAHLPQQQCLQFAISCASGYGPATACRTTATPSLSMEFSREPWSNIRSSNYRLASSEIPECKLARAADRCSSSGSSCNSMLSAAACRLSCISSQNVNLGFVLRFSSSCFRSCRHFLPHSERWPLRGAVKFSARLLTAFPS